MEVLQSLVPMYLEMCCDHFRTRQGEPVEGAAQMVVEVLDECGYREAIQ